MKQIAMDYELVSVNDEPKLTHPDEQWRASLSRIVIHRKKILRLSIASVGVAIGVVLLTPRSWTSNASFVAQTGQADIGQLAGLASQFGVNIGGLSSGFQPRFFSSLVTSDELLRRVASDSFARGPNQPKQPLAGLLGIKGNLPPQERIEKVVRKLRRDVVVSAYDQRTGLTSVTVRTEFPLVSLGITQALLEEVNRFNSERRRSKASIEREFAETRRAAASEELRSAEARVTDFLTQNRSYTGSPELRFEYERLNRRVSELAQVVTSLSQAFEQARIEEVRDTPVLTMVETPQAPAVPDSRSLAQICLTTFIGVILVSIAAILAAHSLGIGLSEQSSGVRWAEQAPQLKEELKRPWRLLF